MLTQLPQWNYSKLFCIHVCNETSNTLTLLFDRIHEEALIKSIIFKLPHVDNHMESEANGGPNYPTLYEMSTNRRRRNNQIPFVAVPYNNKATNSDNPNLAAQQKMSFGSPRYFFRLNCTSAISVG